jgi:hypothetical protein
MRARHRAAVGALAQSVALGLRPYPAVVTCRAKPDTLLTYCFLCAYIRLTVQYRS